MIYIPVTIERRTLPHLLKNSQCRFFMNSNLLAMWSKNDIGVTGFIFHWSVESTRSSILWIVFASNKYLDSSTWTHPTKWIPLGISNNYIAKRRRKNNRINKMSINQHTCKSNNRGTCVSSTLAAIERQATAANWLIHGFSFWKQGLVMNLS